jgi:hypothetical protein
MENVFAFYNHLKYLMAIWYNLLHFGIVCGHSVYFSHFGMFGPRKIWQPCCLPRVRSRLGATCVCTWRVMSHKVRAR